MIFMDPLTQVGWWFSWIFYLYVIWGRKIDRLELKIYGGFSLWDFLDEHVKKENVDVDFSVQSS